MWEVRAMKNTGIGMEGRARNEWACSTSFLGSMGIRRKGESSWKWELACALVSRDSNFLKRVCVKREEGGEKGGDYWMVEWVLGVLARKVMLDWGVVESEESAEVE